MKKAGVVAAVLVVLAAPAGMVLAALFSMVSVMSAGAAQSPCISPIGLVQPMGGPTRWPVTGQFKVTSEYGMRSNPGNINHGQYRLHAGIDLAQSGGPAPIVAAVAGVVSGTPTDVSQGNVVEINHGDGLVTRYLHLASRSVKVGDTVWAGRQIGVEGATGNVTGAHLHFEVRTNGTPINPRGWLTSQGLSVPPTGGIGTAPGIVTAPSAPIPTVQLVPTPLNQTGTVGPARTVISTLPSRVGVWQGEQVTNAAHIIKAGQARELDAKTITIAVMTAMAESSLRNVTHGDAVRGDTIGLFQEGPERGPYEQRMDPAGAANIFYDYLLRVPGYLQLAPTIAAHKAQANADPYHYAPRWPDAVTMVSTLTADPSLLASLPASGPIDGCENGGPGSAPEPGDGTGPAIVEAATHYIGTPYSWGGGTTSGPTLGTYTSPSLDGTKTVGFDCSGLVLFAVYNATGITLPHSAEQQGQDPHGAVVPRDWGQMRPGDVVSFSEDGSGAPGSFGHVGIYIGDGKMIHAPRPGESVQVVQLRGSKYYEPMAWNIRRYATK